VTLSLANKGERRRQGRRRDPVKRRVLETTAPARWTGNDAASLKRDGQKGRNRRQESITTHAEQDESPYYETVEYSEVPVRAQSRESDVSVPARQATITGGLVGLGAFLVIGLLVIAYSIENSIRWPLLWSPLLGFIIGWLITLIMWLDRLKIAEQSLWTIEEIIHMDLTGDGHLGRPPEREVVHRPIPTMGARRPNEPVPTARAVHKTALTPSNREIETEALIEYYLWAIEHGWTKEKAYEFRGEKLNKVGPRLWTDIQNFTKRFDCEGELIWKTKNPPALDWFIEYLQNGVEPNRTERTELSNDV
jgi:hypothetical protein